MSGLPTLLQKGFVVPPKSMSLSDRKKLENQISIDYILGYISDRISHKRGSSPKIKAKNPGDRVIILKAATGSAKSTALPAKLYTTFHETVKKNIIVTQPRILTAMDIPSTIVPFFPELELDKNIGYNTGSFKRLPKEKGLIFSTIGVLTQQLITWDDEQIMSKYQFIIIDEVHERDIETDLCLFMLKKFLTTNYDNPDCPLVILTSATFNEAIFADYFGVPSQNYIQVTGSTFPIEEFFPNYSISNYIEFATLKAQKLHLDNLGDLENDVVRDIIIFVKDTGVGKKIYKSLMRFNSDILDNVKEDLIAYSSKLTTKLDSLEKKGGNEKRHFILPILLDKKSFESGGLEYQNLFSSLHTLHVPLWKFTGNTFKIELEKLQPYKYVTPSRRIIIATNIAETGVTIPTLKYCIDTGYHLNVEFNPDVGCFAIFPKNVTRGMAVQRRGRVGRKAPGQWYPCYTKDTFQHMQEEQFSKIIVSDTTDTLLGILIKEKKVEVVEIVRPGPKSFQKHILTDNHFYELRNVLDTNLASLDFIEMPSMAALSYSLEKLHLLGLVNDKYDVTLLGFYCNQIRFITVELKRMILAGFDCGANVLDLVTIAAFVYISKRKIFSKNFRMFNFLKQNDLDFEFYNRILFADEFINCIFVWNTFHAFIQKKLANLDNVTLEKIDNSKTTFYKNVLYTEEIKEWCETQGLIYDGLLEAIAMRDQIIENLITLGINPYYNSLQVPKNAYNLNKIICNQLSEGIDEIKKLKYAIYEGYKCNLLIHKKTTNQNSGYFTALRNIPVKVKSNFVSELNAAHAQQTKPMHLVVSSYTLSQIKDSPQFEFVAEEYISILDNYMEVDENFYSY